MNNKKEHGTNNILHEAIHTIVEDQLKGNNPKEVNETLMRLMGLGYDRHESIHKIGAVLIQEIYWIEKNQKPYDNEHYVNKLKNIK